MKILLAVASYFELTGAELYCYELAKELIRLGHKILIASPRVGGTIKIKSDEAGIQSMNLYEIPKSSHFDILHLQEPQPTEFLLQRFPHIPAIMTIHSQWPCERPILSHRIKKYIAIRSDIAEKLKRVDGIPAKKISIIHNGIDFSRFNHDYMTQDKERKVVLFVGTLDKIRRSSLLDLGRRSMLEEYELWIVGKPHAFGGQDIPGQSRWFPPVWEIERFVKACDETAGIMLGRSTIEGWACGKPGWIYDVDLEGKIRSRTYHPVPEKMDEFDIRVAAKKILREYEEALAT
jgi:hypothetical protein